MVLICIVYIDLLIPLLQCQEKSIQLQLVQARHPYYACFDQFRHDPQAYAYAVFRKAIEPCTDMIIEELKRLQDYNMWYIDVTNVSFLSRIKCSCSKKCRKLLSFFI